MTDNVETYVTFEQPTEKYVVTINNTTKIATVKSPNGIITIANIPFEQFWIGKQFLNDQTEQIEELPPGHQFRGHTMLLQLKEPNTYVYISSNLLVFKAGNIDTFFSYLVENANPHAYACDESFVYFFMLCEGICKYPRSKITEVADRDYYQQMFELEIVNPSRFRRFVTPVASQSYASYASAKQKNIQGKIANASKVPFVSSLTGKNIPDNAESVVSSFLTGKKGSRNQQMKALNRNLTSVGGKRKTHRQRRNTTRKSRRSRRS